MTRLVSLNNIRLCQAAALTFSIILMCDFTANFPAFNKSIVVLHFLQQVNSLSAG